MGNCNSTIDTNQCLLCKESISIQDKQFLMCPNCKSMYHYKCAYNRAVFLENCMNCGIVSSEIKNESVKLTTSYRNSV